MNYDLVFPNPFWVGINLIDSEDKLPSFNCLLDMKLDMPRGTFSYSAKDIWFECSMLDQFESDLEKLKRNHSQKAELFDMDRELILKISKTEIELSVQRITMEYGKGYIEFKQYVNSEIIDNHLENLRNFPKWW